MTLRILETKQIHFASGCGAVAAIVIGITMCTASICHGQPAMPPAGQTQTRSAPIRTEAMVARNAAPNVGIPLSAPDSPAEASESSGGLGPGGRVVMSLSVVLGVFFLVAWMGRKRGTGQTGSLPAEAVELLGEIPIGGDDMARLLRVGAKLVLISRSSHGLAPLTEITDPAEVQRMTELCHVMQRGDTWRGGNA